MSVPLYGVLRVESRHEIQHSSSQSTSAARRDLEISLGGISAAGTIRRPSPRASTLTLTENCLQRCELRSISTATFVDVNCQTI